MHTKLRYSFVGCKENEGNRIQTTPSKSNPNQTLNQNPFELKVKNT